MSIDLDAVRFGYADNVPVLDGLTAAAAVGEAVALTGANGSGKTTLTRLLVALEQPWSGEVTVAGGSTRGLHPSDLAPRVAYVFQHPGRQLFARTALDEVAFAPRTLGRSGEDALRRAREALRAVGLAQVAESHPHDLPPGEQKLVSLAAALAQDPAVLILDEPTQGLDREGLLRVAAVVRDRVAAGVTVLTVTHDMTLVAEACDTVWVLGGGRVREIVPAADLFRDPERCAAAGLSVPPVPDLARRMGWGPDRFRLTAGPPDR